MTEPQKNRHIPGPPVGWPLLPVPKDGTLNYPSLEESIKQYIRILLLTRPGEQLMRPYFGAGLPRFLHQSNTLGIQRQVQDTIIETLGRWEKRIILDRVDVWQEDRPDRLRIEIAYRIKRSNSPGSMMLKMNLGK